jgi:coproporphyrinogen III oxidase
MIFCELIIRQRSVGQRRGKGMRIKDDWREKREEGGASEKIEQGGNSTKIYEKGGINISHPQKQNNKSINNNTQKAPIDASLYNGADSLTRSSALGPHSASLGSANFRSASLGSANFRSAKVSVLHFDERMKALYGFTSNTDEFHWCIWRTRLLFSKEARNAFSCPIFPIFWINKKNVVARRVQW